MVKVNDSGSVGNVRIWQSCVKDNGAAGGEKSAPTTIIDFSGNSLFRISDPKDSAWQKIVGGNRTMSGPAEFRMAKQVGK